MDTLLRSEKPAGLISFSLDEPVLYYPVRHHSPACAWHLEQVIGRYEPDCILVEGPENANDLIPVLTHPDTSSPVTLYYSYRDEAGLLDNGEGRNPGEEAERFRCYYPFVDCSPELVALRAAASRGIAGYFIDLPYGEILLATRQTQGLRSGERKPNYASDRYLAVNEVQRWLCEKTGLRSFEEFWEKYFEAAGLAQTDEEFVRQVNVYCLLARENTPEEQLEAEGCLAREAHMAQRIQEAAQKYKRVLVVAGGFHIWGLLHPQVQSPVPRIPHQDQAVYPMRYTMSAMDMLSGYASGMPAPGFYDDLWQGLHQKEHSQLWESVVLDYLVKTGRRLRAKGKTISVFDEICAMEQARGLAQLREKRGIGLYELQDAVLSSFVKGETGQPANVEPLQILYELTCGAKMGQLCNGAAIPPLVSDFNEKCKQYRLSLQGGGRQEVTLMIFSKPRHRAISRFLHQCQFLECKFAEKKKGPDLQRRVDRNLIREIWEYCWSAWVEAELIEHSVAGSTMEEACTTQLRQQMAAANHAGQGAGLLVQGFLMGLEDVMGDLTDLLDRLILEDGDFGSLCEACAALNTLEEWKTQYGEIDSFPYEALLGRCFQRVLNMLPAMNQVGGHTVDKVQQACVLLYQMTCREAFADQRSALIVAFEQLVCKNPIHPVLHGCVLGLLYGNDPSWKTAVMGVVNGYLQGTADMVQKSAAFLQGLFGAARDLLLIDPDFLAEIDGLLCRLGDEEFVLLLPELRLAFSYFVPVEGDRLARRVAELHGEQELRHRSGGIEVEQYTWGEALDRWAAAQLDSMDMEGGEQEDDQ